MFPVWAKAGATSAGLAGSMLCARLVVQLAHLVEASCDALLGPLQSSQVKLV